VAVGEAVEDVDELDAEEAPRILPPLTIWLRTGESTGTLGAGIGKVMREGSRWSSSLLIIA